MSLSRSLVLLVSVAVPLPVGAQGAGDSCRVDPSEQQRLLALPPDSFDQQKQGGWREIAGRQCFASAAALVDRYASVNHRSLNADQLLMLRWHAGQLYAYAGDRGMARIRMLEALDPSEPDPPFFPWNDYVRATVAFLDGHRDLLLEYRRRIAATVSRGNLGIVDALLEHFGRPYLEASPYVP